MTQLYVDRVVSQIVDKSNPLTKITLLDSYSLSSYVDVWKCTRHKYQDCTNKDFKRDHFWKNEYSKGDAKYNFKKTNQTTNTSVNIF